MGHGLPVPCRFRQVPAGVVRHACLVWLSEQGVEVRFASGLGEPGGEQARHLAACWLVQAKERAAYRSPALVGAIGVAGKRSRRTAMRVIKLRGVSHDSGLLGSEITVGGTAGTIEPPQFIDQRL